MKPMDFLSMVWGDQTGYVFLPQKGQRWRESDPFHWPEDRDKIEAHVERGNSKEYDQYYCPNLFSEPKRRKEYVLPPRWLYADLDAVDPRRIPQVVAPTVAIQSSPGRFQALWRLSRRLDPERHQDLNRQLSYALGADHGGWDLTQVLRYPGTRNFKYPSRVEVQLLWSGSERIDLPSLTRYLRTASGVGGDIRTTPESGAPFIAPDQDARSLRKALRDRLDPRTSDLLTQKALRNNPDSPTGVEERSDRLWELECRLLEIGCEPEEVFVLVKDTVWNKFEGRAEGDAQLWREIQKAHLHVGTVRPVEHAGELVRIRPRLISYSDLLSSKISEPDWLIEDWWTMGSHGVIAGLPKSYKSLVALDMAVSVASQTPFLGLHTVNPKGVGPVLIIQQENSLPLLRDRLFKISHNRGLQPDNSRLLKGNRIEVMLPPALPILFYNDFGFDMTMADDRESIEEVIRNEGIKLVIFDPLYLMIGGADENVAKEMRPILSWLLRLRNLYSISLVVVHHWGKGSGNNAKQGRGQGGLRLLGSTTIYGWLEAALYLESKPTAAGFHVVAEREFRERLSPPPISLGLSMGDIGDSHYAWSRLGTAGSSNETLDAIRRAGEAGATLEWIRNETEMSQKKIRSEVTNLLESGRIKETLEGRTKRYHASE